MRAAHEQSARGWPGSTKDHQLIVSHGNRRQVQAAGPAGGGVVDPYPLDILGAETQGMIGYLLEQELGNVLPVRGAAGHDPCP